MILKEKTIAVLPFVNMSSDPENEYFSDGITEEIINALAKLDGLKVTSRTSAFYFKNKNIPITEIGTQLNVSSILEGSVRLSGKAMRITAQLIEANEDFHFWSETWDRQTDNIFEVQDEISLLIADRLREHLGHFEIQEHLVQKQTDNLDAYTLFLKGRYHFNKWNPDDVKTAMGYYQQALEVDPNHTNSLVGLADSYSFLATCGFISFGEGWQKCVQLTNQALAINSTLPAAYYQLANFEFFANSDFSKALQLTAKAIEINPNHVESQQFMSFLCISAGKKSKANEHLKLALRIDPISQETQFYSAYLNYMQEDYSEALTKLNKCLEVNPKNIPALTVKAYCLLMLQRYDDAINFFDSLPPEIVIEGDKVGTCALAYAFKKDTAKLTEYTARLHQLAAEPEGFTAHSQLFLLYAVTGQNDKAFAWVQDSIEKRSPLARFRYADPLAAQLRNDTRYETFRRLLFPEEAIDVQETKKKKQLVDEEKAVEYMNRLLLHIQDNQPYLDPNLSLRTLASQLDIHPNQLSWLLNEHIGKNFNEFINHYRIEAFKHAAKSKANSNLTLMGLAYDSGFNSKTVFNTYFKKETGLTPKQFLQNQ